MSPAGNADRLHAVVTAKRWPDGRAVLAEIRLTLAGGEVVMLSGPSGCGKSTLLSILAGVDADYDGHIDWIGRPRLGVVFQSPRLLPWRTAAENVALAAGGGATARRRAAQALAEIGLGHVADTYPAKLSLGMARRVAIVRALAADPEILLLDEPFVSLDAAAADTVRALVRAAVVGRGTAVLMVSHDPRDGVALADRVLRLAGTPARLVAGDG